MIKKRIIKTGTKHRKTKSDIQKKLMNLFINDVIICESYRPK